MIRTEKKLKFRLTLESVEVLQVSTQSKNKSLRSNKYKKN